MLGSLCYNARMLPPPVDVNVLANSEAFRTFSHIMVNLTGLAVAIYSPEAMHLRAYTVTHDRNPLCVLIRSHPDGLACCRASESERFTEVVMAQKARCCPCHAGFIELAIPVIHEEKVIAIISSGQLLPTPPSEEGLQALWPLCAQFEIDPALFREGYARCTYLAPQQIDAAIALLTFFATYLCAMTPLWSESDNPATMVAYVQRYIQTHLTKDLSLSQVAAIIHRSPGYLSRQFERITESTYTHYVQQERIEHVRHLLVHTIMPMTEIAMRCGFTSISQFNRTFQKFAHCTPRTYRARYQ